MSPSFREEKQNKGRENWKGTKQKKRQNKNEICFSRELENLGLAVGWMGLFCHRFDDSLLAFDQLWPLHTHIFRPGKAGQAKQAVKTPLNENDCFPREETRLAGWAELADNFLVITPDYCCCCSCCKVILFSMKIPEFKSLLALRSLPFLIHPFVRLYQHDPLETMNHAQKSSSSSSSTLFHNILRCFSVIIRVYLTLYLSI